MNKSLCLLFLCLSLWSCNKTENSKEQNIVLQPLSSEDSAWQAAEASSPKMPLNEQLNYLSDSITTTWKKLSEADKKKFDDIYLIIKEFKKIKGVNKTLLDSVETLTKQTQTARYNEQTLGSLQQLDLYDNLLETLIDKLDRLETTTQYIKSCRNCFDIFEEIRAIDSQDLINRVRYNSFAKDYNQILRTQKTAIETLGDKYKQLKEAPQFAESK